MNIYLFDNMFEFATIFVFLALTSGKISNIETIPLITPDVI